MAKKVLLVDDSTTTLMMEEMILKQRTSYECVTAKDGLDAISRAVVEAPDLVLMDVVMPRMNGFEACKRMRTESSLSKTPIILVTTRGGEEYVEAGFQSGCNDYITKPINGFELVTLLQSLSRRIGTFPARMFRERMNMMPDSPAKDERKNSAQTLGNQAKVYAARMRLQNAIDQADALDAIRKIAGNLIGTEEVAVFKIDKKRSELWLYWSSGVDPNKHSVLEVRREPSLKQVLSGKPVFRLRLSTENLLSTDDPVNALVPVLVDGSACAVIVLFRLFPHKAEIESVDREICEVLSNCAGRAIEPYQSR